MNKETGNAVYESGTMRTEEGEQSEDLFDYVKVQPGNSLIHFVTLEAATGEMLLYVLHNVLNTSRYGARETRTGRNVQNATVGPVFGEHDTPLSTGELLMEYHEEDRNIVESTGEYVGDVSRTDWEVYSDAFDGAQSFPDWFERQLEIADRTASDADEVFIEEFTQVTEAARAELLDD
jgi:CRISPR-associated protein Csc2